MFATEIGKLLDASNINQQSFEALLLYVGLHPIHFRDLPALLLTRGALSRLCK